MPVIKKRKAAPQARTASGRPTKKRGIIKQIAAQIAANNKKFMEVKQSVFTSNDGIEISHNNFITLDNNPLSTSQGTAAPNASIFNNRIGDKINLKGCRFSMMLELNERFSDVTFRIMVVKCAKGDAPTRANLFNNISGNKMIDTINKERFTVLAQKWVKMKSPNIASNGAASGGGLSGAGTYDMLNGQQTLLSRATKIVKLYVPGKKFVRNGVVTYEGGSAQVKFYDYKVLVYAYSNFGTLQDVFNVGRVNDYVNQMYFTDA